MFLSRLVYLESIRALFSPKLNRIKRLVEDLRQRSEIQDMGRWVRQRRKYWNKHRMEDNIPVKIAKTSNPVGKRTQGRHPKRWKECWTSTSEEA